MSDLEPGVQLTPSTAAAMERLSTSPSKPPMTEIEELRARIEALEACDKEDANCWQSVRASIHGLRERVEALEGKYETMRLATLEWGADVDMVKRWSDQHLLRIMALEATQHTHVDTSRPSETVRMPLKVATETTYGTAPIVAPSAAGSAVERNPECLASWPDCYAGGYDPRCCRFPKSCSCEVRQEAPANPLKSAVHADFTGPQIGSKESLAIPLPLTLVELITDSLPYRDAHQARAVILVMAAWLREQGIGAAGWAMRLEQEANR